MVVPDGSRDCKTHRAQAVAVQVPRVLHDFPEAGKYGRRSPAAVALGRIVLQGSVERHHCTTPVALPQIDGENQRAVWMRQ
ncbi:hypothetical protein GCM10009744_05580 [Kribbella alba]|uniref:Uncharacterized protein n=1 Tax=Kribbella alba TaxID=190197 RepID=A0ABP4QSU6_9ACTN